MKKFSLIYFFILSILFTIVNAQEDYMDGNDDEDPLSVGGGSQQTCDACRTVMEQLLQEWHTIDNDSFLDAIEEASHKDEYVPVVPEEEEKRKEFEAMVVKRFAKRCKNIDIWIQYKPHIRKTCEEIVRKSGSEIAHILVDKNKEVDTEIMNYLTRVVCMGLNRLCNIKYLNLDARSVNSKCEDCINVARLLDYQTRRASRKYIGRGYFFNDLLESVCETIPFFYSHPSKIGTLCEEMVSDYDDDLIKILKNSVNGDKSSVEENICVKTAHLCSNKEYMKIKNYDYRRAMYDFQDQQNIQTMSMDDVNNMGNMDNMDNMDNMEEDL